MLFPDMFRTHKHFCKVNEVRINMVHVHIIIIISSHENFTICLCFHLFNIFRNLRCHRQLVKGKRRNTEKNCGREGSNFHSFPFQFLLVPFPVSLSFQRCLFKLMRSFYLLKVPAVIVAQKATFLLEANAASQCVIPLVPPNSPTPPQL